MKFIKIINKYKFTIICLIAIFYLSFIDTSDIKQPKQIFLIPFDLIAHFSMYCGTAFIFFIEKYRKKEVIFKIQNNQKYLFFFIILGFLIEIFQPILSNRSRELSDFLANTAGCYVGLFVFLGFKKYWK